MIARLLVTTSIGSTLRRARRVFRSEFFEKIREAIQARGPTRIEPHLNCRVAIRGRLEARVDRESRLAIVPGKGDRYERARRQPAPAAMAAVWLADVDDPLGLDDLAIDALAWTYAAIGSAHVNAKSAARPRVHFANVARKPRRSPKPRQMLGIGKNLEDKLARRVEYACDDEDKVFGRIGVSCCGHGIRPFVSQAIALSRWPGEGRSSRRDYDHPWHAEAVGDHAEARGKEGLGQRHLHLPPVRQGREQPLGLGIVSHVER